MLNPRERRLAAVAILLTLLTLLWFAIVLPVASGFAERSARREDIAARLAANAAAISLLPHWERRMAALARDAGDYAILADGPQTAADALKARIVAAARRNAIVTNFLQDEPAPAGWVHVRLEADMTLPQLQTMLRELENARPGVVIDSLAVSADQAFRTGHLSPMDVRVEIVSPYQPATPG